jgi:uracil-DNA glycosylase
MSLDKLQIKDFIKYTCDGWKELLQDLWNKHGDNIQQKINNKIFCVEVLPNKKDVFRAFNFFPMRNLRVVILGQDPYINKGEGNGLCFSVNNECKIPPSLKNIFKELHRCYRENRIETDLSDWANQGVLLLNTALTVLENTSGSHSKIWKSFTHDLLEHIGQYSENVVFILWGSHAQSYKNLINVDKNLILEHSHPSPLSRKSFVGNNHFILCNEYLKSNGYNEIKWI